MVETPTALGFSIPPTSIEAARLGWQVSVSCPALENSASNEGRGRKW